MLNSQKSAEIPLKNSYLACRNVFTHRLTSSSDLVVKMWRLSGSSKNKIPNAKDKSDSVSIRIE